MNDFVIDFTESNNTFNILFGEGTVIPGSSTNWDEIINKPFSTIGDNLKVENDVLKVDVTNTIEANSPKPITSGAVYTEVGNIDILLGLI